MTGRSKVIVDRTRDLRPSLTKGTKTKTEAAGLSQICFAALAGVGPWFT